MKKIFTTVICVLLLTVADAQKISEKEAQQFLEKVWGYLKTSDSLSFVNLWSPEDSVWQRVHTPVEGLKLTENFNRLKNFLSPALSQNLAITRVEVGEENAAGTKITAYIKAREHASIGYLFYVVRMNDKLIPRGKPGYLAMSK
jgi:hypothetical protein